MSDLTMYFDATCPFAWVTSRWLLEVEKVRDINVNFRPMSLAVLNEGIDHDEEYDKKMDAAWAPALVAAAIYKNHPDKVRDYYTAVGTAIHNEGRANITDIHGYDEVIKEAVQKIGLPNDFLDNVGLRPEDDNAYVDDLKKSHEEGISLVGNDVGTPVVVIDGRGFFGPVITRIPTGEKAGELFDAAVTLGSYEHFWELKRTRNEDPKPEFDN